MVTIDDLALYATGSQKAGRDLGEYTSWGVLERKQGTFHAELDRHKVHLFYQIINTYVDKDSFMFDITTQPEELNEAYIPLSDLSERAQFQVKLYFPQIMDWTKE